MIPGLGTPVIRLASVALGRLVAPGRHADRERVTIGGLEVVGLTPSRVPARSRL